MIETIWFLLPFLAMFLIGLGLWALGQFMRRKGYGEQLNKIDKKVTAAQQQAHYLLRPIGGAMLGLGRGFSKAPLFGSRRQRDAWDKLEELCKQQDKDL